MKNVTDKPVIKKMATIIALTSILMTVSFFTFAQDDGNRDGPRFERFQKGEHQRANIEKRMQRISKALNLTESQVELLKLSHQPPKKNRAELNELRKELHELTQSSDYTEREANKIAKQITALTQGNIVARSNAQNAFYVSLSEEQIATLNAMRKKMKGKRH